MNQNTGVLSIKQRINFAIGEFGSNLICYWVNAFLLIFYTDVFGIPLAVVSALTLFGRGYDAVSDPIMASIMDRGDYKMGRYRPWLLWGSIGYGISMVFLFWAHPEWPVGIKVAYVCLTYILMYTFRTALEISYYSLNSCLSSNSEERYKAAGLKLAFLTLAMLVLGYVGSPMVDYFGQGDSSRGYVLAVLATVIVGLPFLLYTVFTTKEAVRKPVDQKKISVRQQFGLLFRNQPAIILMIGKFAFGFQMFGRLSPAMYYFTYTCGNPSLFALYNAINSLLAIVGNLLAPAVSKWIHKKSICIYGLFLCGICMGAQYFFMAPHVMFYVLTAISGLCFGVCASAMAGMATDTVAYTQIRDGYRIDGFLNASSTFANKVGIALTGSVTTAMLAYYGYVANAVQTQETLAGINVIFNILPALVSIVAAVLFIFYHLNENELETVR